MEFRYTIIDYGERSPFNRLAHDKELEESKMRSTCGLKAWQEGSRLFKSGHEVEPKMRFELTTCCLRNSCSTPELLRPICEIEKKKFNLSLNAVEKM